MIPKVKCKTCFLMYEQTCENFHRDGMANRWKTTCKNCLKVRHKAIAKERRQQPDHRSQPKDFWNINDTAIYL